MDLLASGPRRPRRAPRAWRRRSVRVAAAVLVAAAALALLRFTVDRSAVDRPAAAASTPPPAAVPRPTFDRLPGRTPIPEPAQTGDLLSGLLPAIGGPSRATAGRATGLVLGRYCADLARYTLTLQPDTNGRADDFHHLDVLVTDRELTDAGPAMRLTLDWQGRVYRWLGPLTLLNGC